MNYLKKVILFLLMVKLNVLLVQNLSAQSKSECQQTFTKYVLGLGEYEVPKDGKHYFVHTVASTFPNKELKEYEPSAYSSENINVRVVIAKGKMFYYSNYIDFYQDNNDLFTVIHPQKLIIWRKPEAKEKQGQSIEFMPFRKQMLEELLFTSCVDVILDKKKVKKITLTPKTQDIQGVISKIIYWYDERISKLEKQEIIYSEGQTNLRQEVIYKEFNPDYREKVASSAVNNVFDSRKKLLDRFKGYSVEFQ